ncbi:MAG: hypothetical protein F4Z41_07570 [Acidimicrobiia bacterium]|nr:hypothetical protein [bacterium]MXX00206.1 hypothetical protein [Acidimicrobiia bacterium]MDE0121451.1 hypothetical protein [bacterium]MDE0500236.1 hypothetical protein [bacterium]MXX46049.1 hypothetical protein [Acidimicrobiia bacterium]
MSTRDNLVRVDDEDCDLAALDARMGVIDDPTGDYEAGRTIFHPTTDDFLEFLASQPYESD